MDTTETTPTTATQTANKRPRRRRWTLTPKTTTCTCTMCSTVFQGKHVDAMYCSASCKQQAYRERLAEVGKGSESA